MSSHVTHVPILIDPGVLSGLEHLADMASLQVADTPKHVLSHLPAGTTSVSALLKTNQTALQRRRLFRRFTCVPPHQTPAGKLMNYSRDVYRLALGCMNYREPSTGCGLPGRIRSNPHQLQTPTSGPHCGW